MKRYHVTYHIKVRRLDNSVCHESHIWLFVLFFASYKRSITIIIIIITRHHLRPDNVESFYSKIKIELYLLFVCCCLVASVASLNCCHYNDDDDDDYDDVFFSRCVSIVFKDFWTNDFFFSEKHSPTSTVTWINK